MSDSETRVRETLITMPCEGEMMMGIAHIPGASSDIGMVLVVGGPQYRVGSHRQFVLLARDLANQGIPVLRFDYRGMGDSSGPMRDFEAIGPDIRAAIDGATVEIPQVKRWVLWGLCDAATAAAFYAPQDKRVAGLILLNPWVRTEAGASEAYLKHYYLQRILNPVFWKKVCSGGFQWGNSWQSLKQKLLSVYRGKRQSTETGQHANDYSNGPLPVRLQAALQAFTGSTLMMLSGNDLTAKEFEQAVAQSNEFQGVVGCDRVEQVKIEDADHTFSRRIWRDQVATMTFNWINKL